MKTKIRRERVNDVKCETVTMSFEKFVKIPPWDTQRWEERLKKGQRCHILLTIPDYMDELAHNQMMKFVSIVEFPNGKQRIVNGNTRRFAYTQNPEKVQYDIPKEFYVIVHHISTQRQGQTIYDMYDPIEASKNSGERITEAYRSLGILGKFNTPQFKWGTSFTTTALIISKIPGSNFVMNSNRKKFKTSHDYYNFISWCKKELLHLDDLLFQYHEKKSQKFDVEILVTFLIFLKKYGLNNERLNEGIIKYIEGWNMAHTRKEKIDGITFINEKKDKLIEDGNENKKTNTNNIIYFMKSWMDNELRNRMPNRGVTYFNSFFGE